MANSSIVDTMKDAVIKELIRDDLIVDVIDGQDIEEAEDLINTHIFRYDKNPNIVNSSITFLTIQVNVRRGSDRDGIWVKPVLIITIYSHDDHMNITNIPLIPYDRNDYLASLIDNKFNGRSDLGGYGRLMLTSNTEEAFNEKFLYRRLVFETRDINDSICG